MTYIWRLEAMSFEGTVVGASHWYGVLCGPEGKYAIQAELTESAARDLNVGNLRFGFDDDIGHKEGDITQRFGSQQAFKDAAIACFRHVSEGDDVMVMGSFGTVGPQEPLAGPVKLLDVLRPIWEYDESEKSYDWTDIREQANRQWNAAMRDYDLEYASAYETLGELTHKLDGTVEVYLREREEEGSW